MPPYFLPRKSSAHRIACKALYRALLEQCPRIPLTPELQRRGPTNPIEHFVRRKFKQSVYITSPAQVVKSLKAGYAAEQLLRHAASGSHPAALSQTHALIAMLHAQSELAHSLTPKPIPRARPPRPEPYPGAKKVLDIRPLPKEKLTGRRHVPHIHFTNAHRTAFLQFKKPQSAYLSRMLRQIDEARAGRLEFVEEVKGDIEIAKGEALWERLVAEEVEAEGGDVERVTRGDRSWGVDSSWTRELTSAKRGVEGRLTQAFAKAHDVGVRMMDIKEEEERLWREERSERKKKKDEERRARKRGREVKEGRTRPEDKVKRGGM